MLVKTYAAKGYHAEFLKSDIEHIVLSSISEEDFDWRKKENINI
jgi:hypothetical protein